MKEASDRGLGKRWESGVNASAQQLGEQSGGQRRTEEVALSLRAVPRLKKCELFRSFDAFGNDALLEVDAHGDGGANDGRFVGVSGDFVHKGFVNLQDVDGKLLEIAEAGIAGAEVIESNVNSDRLERAESGRS